MVDLVSHQLLGFRVEAMEYVTRNIWLAPAVKPYHDLLAAACKRQGIEMVVTLKSGSRLSLRGSQSKD
jgi:hypothetical protein